MTKFMLKFYKMKSIVEKWTEYFNSGMYLNLLRICSLIPRELIALDGMGKEINFLLR